MTQTVTQTMVSGPKGLVAAAPAMLRTRARAVLTSESGEETHGGENWSNVKNVYGVSLCGVVRCDDCESRVCCLRSSTSASVSAPILMPLGSGAAFLTMC